MRGDKNLIMMIYILIIHPNLIDLGQIAWFNKGCILDLH